MKTIYAKANCSGCHGTGLVFDKIPFRDTYTYSAIPGDCIPCVKAAIVEGLLTYEDFSTSVYELLPTRGVTNEENLCETELQAL